MEFSIGSLPEHPEQTSSKSLHDFPKATTTSFASPTTTVVSAKLIQTDRFLVSTPDLFQGIVDGDEIALRDAFRRYGAAANELARRIIGPEQAAEIVEEAFLLIWTEPERWASPALDVHVLRIVRDLSLAVQRRGVTASLAARDLEPAGAIPDLSAPDIINELDHTELQRLLLRLPDGQGLQLEAGWFEATRSDDAELNAALTTFADGLLSGRLTKQSL